MPGLYLICGAPNTGKSYLLKYLLHKDRYTYNHGVVIASTAFNGFYDFIPPRYLHQTYDPDFMNTFLEFQGRTRKPSFLVLDDMAGRIKWSKSQLTDLATTYRHYNLSIYICMQYVHKIPPAFREACTECYIFKQRTKNSFNALFESFGADFEDKEQFITYLKENASQRNHTYISINNVSGEKKTGKAPSLIPQFRLDY